MRQSDGSPFSKLVQRPLIRTSICPCGYSVLYEFIQPGAVYTLDMSTLRGGFIYTCGRCGVQPQTIQCVKATQQMRPDLPMDWLPYGLFEVAA